MRRNRSSPEEQDEQEGEQAKEQEGQEEKDEEEEQEWQAEEVQEDGEVAAAHRVTALPRCAPP